MHCFTEQQKVQTMNLPQWRELHKASWRAVATLRPSLDMASICKHTNQADLDVAVILSVTMHLEVIDAEALTCCPLDCVIGLCDCRHS